MRTGPCPVLNTSPQNRQQLHGWQRVPHQACRNKIKGKTNGRSHSATATVDRRRQTPRGRYVTNGQQRGHLDEPHYAGTRAAADVGSHHGHHRGPGCHRRVCRVSRSTAEPAAKPRTPIRSARRAEPTRSTRRPRLSRRAWSIWWVRSTWPAWSTWPGRPTRRQWRNWGRRRCGRRGGQRGLISRSRRRSARRRTSRLEGRAAEHVGGMATSRSGDVTTCRRPHQVISTSGRQAMITVWVRGPGTRGDEISEQIRSR